MHASHTHDTPRSVIVADANVFRMPLKCVICGTDVSQLFSYTQDHLPLLLPGVGLVRTTQVSLPYCEHHCSAFQERFRKLRLAQRVAYGIGLVAPMSSVFISGKRELNPVACVVFLSALLFLAISIFVIKPFLYDAFVTRSGKRIRIKSRSRVFIRNVIEANCPNVI